MPETIQPPRPAPPRDLSRYRSQRLRVSGAALLALLALVLADQFLSPRLARRSTGQASATLGAPARAAPPTTTTPPATTGTTASEAVLRWEDLRRGTWERGSQPQIPGEVRRLEGRRVSLTGFVLPLHSATAASELFLAGNPGGCYFCSPPGIADVVMVKTAGGTPVALQPYPAVVRGRLTLARGSGCDTALYTLLEAEVTFCR